MRIFISHSSRQKLLVKELRRRLPHPVNLWIDEYEIPIGGELDATLRSAIERECDLFVLVLDTWAAKSPWVRQEIDWALAREDALKRLFLLPILVDQEALKQLDNPRVASRSYLPCASFTDEGISALADRLSSELFAWLDRELKRTRQADQPSALGMLREAETVKTALADAIKAIVHQYRRDTPLPVSELLQRLNAKQITKPMDLKEISELLQALQRQSLISGVSCDDDVIYLATERFSFKENLHVPLKRRVARKAVSLIRSGQTVALDGGTTVLELTNQLAQRLKSQDLSNLSVVTHSIPAAFTLLNTLSDLGAGDVNSYCNVYVAGGRGRPVSLTLVSAGDLVRVAKNLTGDIVLDGGAGLRGLLEMLGGADIAFVGTNGLYERRGFAVQHEHEVFAKKLMIEHSRRRVVLADPSKFAVQQDEPFAFFEQGLTVITADDREHSKEIEDLQQALSSTSSEMIFA